MSLVEVPWEALRLLSSPVALSRAGLVVASPSWYRPIRDLGMGKMNGGLSRVMGIFLRVVVVGSGTSPTCGMGVSKA